MKLGDSKAIKTAQWFANEILLQSDINFVGESNYQNLTDLLAILAEQGIASGSTPDIILGGLLLEFSATLSSNLRAGAAISYQGYYLDTYGAWGFQASAGDVFSIVVPDNQVVTVDAGGSQGRVDTIEIRPIKTEYNSESRQFKDPITGLVSSVIVKTRKEYGVEVQILKGTEGSSPVALAHTAGWIKVAEVFVDASASSIDQDDIKDVRDSDTWTTEASETTYKSSYFKLDVVGAIRSGQITIASATHYDALDVSRVNSVLCNTVSNNIIIGGLANGLKGQVVHFFKGHNNNMLRIEHNEGTGTQKIYVPNAMDRDLTSAYGGFTLECSGIAWFMISE